MFSYLPLHVAIHDDSHFTITCPFSDSLSQTTFKIDDDNITYISGINYAIRSSLYLLLLILDNIVSSDIVSVS